MKIGGRVVVFGLVSAVAIFLMVSTITNYWVEIYQKYKQKDELEEQLVELEEEEERLKVDVDRLQDIDYIARYAREKYLYSKEGELIFRLPKE